MSTAVTVVVTPGRGLEVDCLSRALRDAGFAVGPEVEETTDVVVVAISRTASAAVAVELLESARESAPPTLVLVDDEALLRRAELLGLTATSWRSTQTSVVHAVRAVAAGSTAPPSRAATRVRDLFDSLTEREREVMALVARGRQDSEIASSLGIGTSTVRTYVQQALQKLGAPHRHAAATLVWSSAVMEDHAGRTGPSRVGAVGV